MELFNNLQKAETDEEKELSKQEAQEYIKSISNDGRENISDGGETQNTETTDTTEETDVVAENEEVVEETVGESDFIDTIPDNEVELPQDTERDEEKIKLDLSQLAFNPRLAKCGITREEELFLQGVRVRKLSHEEKILLRRSIYQKKNQRNAQIQAEFRAKRAAQRQKDLNDPEKIKYHRERKYVLTIVDALQNHKNFVYIFSQIDGLTPEIVRELLQKPENVNAFRQAKPTFIDDFYKKYGK